MENVNVNVNVTVGLQDGAVFADEDDDIGEHVNKLSDASTCDIKYQ